MNIITITCQIIIALGLLNVWLLRYSRKTDFRGGSATNLKEEFAAYGLPSWFHYFIGALKIGSALALLVGVWVPAISLPAALLVCLLMLGALAMHLKIGDPVKKSAPAFAMLVLSVAVLLTSRA
jgi:uncharacterized membrane protein YphA (DoxX/SURF4 family)